MVFLFLVGFPDLKAMKTKEIGLKKYKWILLFLAAGIILAVGTYVIYRVWFSNQGRTMKVLSFIRSPEKHQDLILPARSRCGDTPFILPTSGMIGFIWGDSFRPGHKHQGIDIFSGTDVGVTPIYAAYDGYLTRSEDWKSSVIIRVPNDPLMPDRQIWTYYTHMADPSGSSLISEAFPPGTQEVFVSAGTLLGYQGNYSGTPGNPTGVHLHFSIVKDDGNGLYLNELEFGNTLNPSPYFGLALNARENSDSIPTCLAP